MPLHVATARTACTARTARTALHALQALHALIRTAVRLDQPIKFARSNTGAHKMIRCTFLVTRVYLPLKSRLRGNSLSTHAMMIFYSPGTCSSCTKDSTTE